MQGIRSAEEGRDLEPEVPGKVGGFGPWGWGCKALGVRGLGVEVVVFQVSGMRLQGRED